MKYNLTSEERAKAQYYKNLQNVDPHPVGISEALTLYKANMARAEAMVTAGCDRLLAIISQHGPIDCGDNHDHFICEICTISWPCEYWKRTEVAELHLTLDTPDEY